jgi:hypothetical protein
MKTLIRMTLLWLPAALLSAQQVDTDELRRGQASPMAFINYEGPYARVETRGQIWSIGNGPGLTVRNGAQRTGDAARYFVIHSMTEPEDDKIDSDIFGLGIDTGVDHIRNLRLIIQGYLEGAYGYSPADAALLAEYVTVYNAVFRGNWNYFTGRYKTPVVQNLESGKTGLSIRFDEWPGQTLLVIPLALGRAGTLSAANTRSLSSPEVVEEIRKDDGMGIDLRREMVDLKEREADEAEQRAVLLREAIAGEETRLVRDREALNREREALGAEAAAGNLSPEDALRREAELAAREAEAAGREDALGEQREEAERTEQFAEEKAAEARQERQDIARDQQAIIDRRNEPEAGPDAGILAVRLINPDNLLGRLIQVTADDGREIRASTLNTINVRTVASAAGRLFAVAGENRGNGAVRIVEVNADTLEMIRQGDDDVSPESLIWAAGDKLYAITASHYLARYNADLVREALSETAVHPYATPVFRDDTVLIQRADGSPAILNAADLSER